jgi:hypothetical protein
VVLHGVDKGEVGPWSMREVLVIGFAVLTDRSELIRMDFEDF